MTGITEEDLLLAKWDAVARLAKSVGVWVPPTLSPRGPRSRHFYIPLILNGLRQPAQRVQRVTPCKTTRI